jgi:hypothetical protein
MDKREAGKQKAEEFVTKVANGMTPNAAVDTFLWWPEILPQPGGTGETNETTMPLRVFKGSSWKSISFAGSDLDASVDRPEVLLKYESEVAQCLVEL